MNKHDVHPVIQHLCQLAMAFRSDYPDLPEGRGYVIIYKDQAVGFTHNVTESLTWLPGSLAVDSEGNIWEGVGGDDYEGIDQWVPLGSAFLSFEQVLEQTGISVSDMLRQMQGGSFPLELASGSEGGPYWHKADIELWITLRKRKVAGAAEHRQNLSESQWPQLAKAEVRLANSKAFIDIDKSTGNLLVIQTPSRSIGITLPDLMRLMASYRSPDKQPFLKRVLFGQRRHVH